MIDRLFSDNFIPNLSDFEKVSLIGCGSLGSVYEAINRKTNEKYAIKIVNDSSLSQTAIREFENMKVLKNPGIVEFLYWSPCDFNLNVNTSIVMEYCSNGTLSKVLDSIEKENSTFHLSPTKEFIILIGIALGMKYVHSKGILHLDLKPENILLNEKYYPKISGFGSAMKDKETSQRETPGSIIYMAPEILDSGKVDMKADVYSFAMLMYEIFTKRKPIIDANLNNISIFQNKIINGRRPNLHYVKNQFQKEIIRKCWDHDPNQRPTFTDIIDYLKNNANNIFEDGIKENKVNDYLKQFNISMNDAKLYEDAVSLYNQGQKKEAFNLFETLYKNKYNYFACFNCAYMLETGDGVEMNAISAKQLYKIAASNGIVPAMLNYGYILAEEGSTDEAVKYFENAANLGSNEAIFNLALIHDNRNEKEQAATLYKRASDEGINEASNNYGVMLATGDGCKKNHLSAKRYFKTAAQNGHQTAIKNLEL